jgi:hypothetical protein
MIIFDDFPVVTAKNYTAAKNSMGLLSAVLVLAVENSMSLFSAVLS